MSDQQKSLKQIMDLRLEKLDALINNGINPYPENFDLTHNSTDIKKNYDVSFLLDSYLLHFHGKSSWDGGESIDEIKVRDRKYTEVFLEKSKN